ncbi:MAG TPA: cation:proton antiporter [Actinomycetota bacterium]|nr:cation:proton antiporter [Actinomycetota bacterium]
MGGDRGIGERSGRRIALAYVLLLGFVAAVGLVVFQVGGRRLPAPAIAGVYRLDGSSPCLGDRDQRLRLEQSGQFVELRGPGAVKAELRLRGGRLGGSVACRDGGDARLSLQADGTTLRGSVDGGAAAPQASPVVTATRLEQAEVAATTAERAPGAEETFGQLMLAIAAVILAARGMGAAAARLGQPQVMGEVLAGILLGPTLLATVAPRLTELLFPAFVVPLIRAAAWIGLAFYMFLVGLELDPKLLRERFEQAALISHASIAIPLGLGIAVALPLYELVAPATSFVSFALFMGVAMSITAFPVLARILVERRMLRHPVGAMAMAAAAVDDVTAWGLLALASAVAGSGSALAVVRIVALAVAFCALMVLVGRPLLARVSRAYDEAGHVPGGWIAAIFVGVLLSSFASQRIGIAAIFGAFVMGLIMPRRADLTHDITRRVEDFVVTVLLPLYFVVTGLRVEVGLLDSPELWLLTLVLLLVAIAGKWTGALAAARLTGFSLRESSAIAALMNTRGLTELIVLNIGLELGVITPALFTSMVIVALVTTFMTGPALRLIDPQRKLSVRPEEELQAATEAAPDKAILVAPQDGKNLDSLLALAEPLARSEPRRELIVARLLVSTRIATGLAADDHELVRVAADLHRRRARLIARGLAVRGVAFTSADIADDLLRLASEQEVDLILLDGRRPLLGEGVPRGPVGEVLLRAPCDVAVLVEREAGVPAIDPDHPVLVPFGGAEHDWAALELGAWIASSYGAPLRLLGAAADDDSRRDASRLLANASLVLQQLAGIAAEPLLIEPGREGVLHAAEGAGLLVIGLSEQWRDEGLGPVRSQIARTAPAPTLFVRRGSRQGALAPRDSLTRFTWSSVGPSRLE